MTPSVERVHEVLVGQVSGGEVDLRAAAHAHVDELGALVGVFDLLCTGASWPIVGVQLTRNALSVQLSGKAELSFPYGTSFPVSLTLTYTAAPDVGTFLVRLETHAGWKFETAFGQLPPTLLLQNDGLVASGGSFLADMPVSGVVFTARATTGGTAELELSGTVNEVPQLGSFADFFGPFPLRFEGTVAFRQQAAAVTELSLFARSAHEPITLPGVATLEDFGLRFVTELVDTTGYGAGTPYSTLYGEATLRLGSSQPVTATVSTPLLAMAGTWLMHVAFPEDAAPGLGEGLEGIASLLGVEGIIPLEGPRAFDDFTGFGISEIDLSLTAPGTGSSPGLHYIAVTLQSAKRWVPPVPYLAVRDVGMRWVALWGGDGPSVFGTVEVGRGELTRRAADTDSSPRVPLGRGAQADALAVSDEPAFSLDIATYFPQFAVTGRLADEEIPLGSALAWLFPGATVLDDRLSVTRLTFEADLTAQTLACSADLTTDFSLDIGDLKLALTDVYLHVDAGQGAVGLGLSAAVTLSAADSGAVPSFLGGAEYESAAGWQFHGALLPGDAVDLGALLEALLPWEVGELPSVSVTELSLRFAPGAGTYDVRGAVTGSWQARVLGQQRDLSAGARVTVARDGQGAVTGAVAGSFSVNRLTISVGLDLAAKQQTYLLKVQFGALWVAAVASRRAEDQHEIITVRLGGATLGEIIEYLVGLAAPTVNFTLDPPWDLLGRIELSAFALTIDPAGSTVEFTYGSATDLGVMSADTVGVRWKRKPDGRSTVEMILTGDFLGQSYPEGKELSWDLLGGSPPAVPGQGKSLFDLRYLGIGQRVSTHAPTPGTVKETVALLRKALRPVRPDSGSPVEQLPDLSYSPDSGWLIALQATFLETLDLSFVFDDPRLYGLSIGLRGQRAGSLAGLQFEVLYKKITADIGMFRVDLRLPDAFRRIDLGAVSVTAGSIVVEVCTNGTFLVDLGFPHGRDFSRSFSVDVLPFLGRGGIYFGSLDSATSSRVPRVTNGTFAPVLELGVGLAVGVGKEMAFGPLSGGAYVEVFGIFQGVLGWFNPVRDCTGPATYYWAHAVVGIHGKIYGRLDFAVVQVNVTLEAWAEASVALAAYRASTFRLTADVSVSASVRVLFVNVTFAYRAQLAVEFVVGSDQPTPWVLAEGHSAPTAARLRSHILPPPREARRTLRTLPGPPSGTWSWDVSRGVFPDGPRTAELILLPLFSVDGIAVGWSRTPPAPATPRHRAALLLSAPLGGEAGAGLIVEAFLRWRLGAVSGSPGEGGTTVTAEQVRHLAAALRDRELTDSLFTSENLAAFFESTLHLDVVGRPPDGDPDEMDGMVVAIPPFVLVRSEQVPERDLSVHQKVGPRYVWDIAQYAAQFDASTTSSAPAPEPEDPLTAYRPFAAWVFQDWCLGLARAAVQEAADGLADWPVPAPAEPVSAADLATRFPGVTASCAVRAGDTPDSVAETLGITTADLTFRNPAFAHSTAYAAGAETVVEVGVSPTSIALANADFPLTATRPVPLGIIDHQVESGETLAKVATRFGVATSDVLAAVCQDPAVPRAGAVVELPGFTLTHPGFTSAVEAAAAMFPRYVPDAEVPDLDWYLNALHDLNPDYAGGGGCSLRVPAEFGDLARPKPYTTLPGDSARSVAAALALAQRAATGGNGPSGWPSFRADVWPAADGGFTIPPHRTSIQPRETFGQLAVRLVAYTPQTVEELVAERDILAALALVRVPDVQAIVSPGRNTLTLLAEHYGLPLADLAARLATQPLFARTADAATLRVPDVPAATVDQIAAHVSTGEAVRRVTGPMSRHLLSGQRVPAPAPTTEPDDGHRTATGPLTPLHDLTGQQFDGPAPDPDRPTSVGLSLEVTSAADWLVLRRSEVADGALRRTENVTALTLEFTNAELQRLYPPTVLAVQPERFPEPLPAGEPAPVTYGLDHRIELQSPLPLPLSAEAARATGNASLWPFPAALRARAAMDQETPYDVVRTAAPGSRPRPGDVLSGVTFATTVTFGIRRVGALAHAYELSGVDTVDRDVLLLLRERLATAGGARAFLAVAPTPDAPSSSGLAVLAADEEATYLLKTNESTVSKPPAGDVAAAGRQPHAARLCEVTDFLVLLWQGSVVGGSGYYLGYRTRTGEDLPPGAFDPEGRARLTLLVVLDDRASPAPLGRTLLPCDTCALVAPGLDPSAAVLYVEAADPDAETTMVPVLPQGTVGFTTTLPRPPADDTPPSRAARMFSQLTYGSAAPPGGHGLPVSPSDNDGGGRPAWQRDRLARARRSRRNVSAPGPVHWRYQQALPHGSTAPSPAPAVEGLPAPDKDPYRGIEGERTPGVAIALGFCDVLGNLGISTDTGDAAPYVVDAPLGYRDVLLAVTQWPALSLSYSVEPSAAGPRLSITLAPQAGATAPEPGDSPTRALDAARRQSERYAAAYYQLAGDRVTATVRTTLVPGPDGTPAQLPVDAAPLWRYAAASHLAAAAAGSSTPVTVTGSAADLTARHGTSYQALASANAYNEIRVLFDADPPAVPAYAVVEENRSTEDLITALGPGWPRPADAAEVLTRSENAGLPLRPGTVLRVPPAAVQLTGVDTTLDELAAATHTRPGLLAMDSAETPGVFLPGAVLSWEGRTLEVPSPYSFAAAARAFAALGHHMDAAALATANSDRSGLLAPQAALVSAHYVAAGGDSLAHNASGRRPSDLAELNGSVEDLFPPGTLLRVGDFADVTIPPGQTLQELAERYACPPVLLLAANSDVPLTATLPGCVAVPETVRVPYMLRSQDTLDALGPVFGSTAVELAESNADMPGLLAPYRVVSVTTPAGPVTTETTEGDTLDAVWRRLACQGEVTFEQAVDAVADDPSYLNPGTLLVCGPGVLTGDASAMTPAAAAALYGLDPVAFGLANAGVTGIIAPEVDLTVDGVTITTIGGYDSINTLVTRFAAGGTTLTAAELTSRLAGVAFLRRGARVLLPPAPLTIDVVLPGKPPLSDTTLPFPLTVALRLARPRVLVSPEFRTQGSSPHTVEQAEAPVPPYVTGAGSPQQASLTLESFERSFRNAFPELRLATGHAPEGGTDLSVVSFAEGGITDVRLMPGQAWQGASTRKAPRVFALRPLSRELVSRVGVPVRLLSPEGTLARDATPMDFLGVDVEVWARRLLTDIDLFLTAAYATAVRNDQGTGDALARVIAAKRTLAGAVARGLWPVLDAADPDAQAERDAREAAVEQLAGELAVGLSDGYGTTALVQYDVHVAPPSNCVAGRPARLHGTVASSPGASYSLSSSGIDLSRPVSRTGFLLRLSDPRWQSNVDIDIDYEVLDLEYEIRAEPQVGGYEAGRWLAFRPPLSGDRKPAALQVTPGRAQVPVPLRAYPAPPVLLGQAAGASAAGPSSGAEPLSGAPLWTYSVTYTHEHAAQDEVWVTVAFNVSAEAALSGTGDDDVVSALAAYGCVAEGLWSHLAGYVSGAGTPAARANAAVAFGELVERAAEAWDRRWPLRAEDPPVPGPAGPSAATARGPGHVEATLRVHVGHLSDEGGTWLDAVELTALADGPGPGGTWPEVEYLDMEGHAVRLVPDTPVGSSRTYRCTPRVPTSGRPRLRLHWPNLHVMSYQNARAALSVCRNSRLVPDGPPTDEQFVFRTAPAVAPDVVTPFLVWDTPVDISAAGSIEEALSATFATFTGASGSPSAVVSIDYGFELVAGEAEGQGLVSRLPIALAPLDMTPTAATTVARVASDWLLDNDPPSARGGMLIFSIKLFSPLSQGTRQPLLWMSQLVYRLS